MDKKIKIVSGNFSDLDFFKNYDVICTSKYFPACSTIPKYRNKPFYEDHCDLEKLIHKGKMIFSDNLYIHYSLLDRSPTINILGTISYETYLHNDKEISIVKMFCFEKQKPGINIDAYKMCLYKINELFKNKNILFIEEDSIDIKPFIEEKLVDLNPFIFKLK